MKKLRIALAAAAVAMTLTAAAQTPKYVFYYIGDGMGMGPIMAAQTYNRTILGNDQPLTMMQFPVAAWCQTYSVSSTTTDSAAAGTALSTGTKTKNGMLGMAPDTTVVNSVALDLHNDGWGIGLVTTVAADDATPGAFYGHVPNRKMSYEIDCEFARTGYEFLSGAGLAGLKTDKHDAILDSMASHNVQVVYGPEGISKIDSRRVVLLNTETGDVGNVGYTIDSVAGNLTLPLITQTCLNHLEKYSPERFFMMVEGGNIDHALHANDGLATVIEIINFDEALQIAYDFYKQHPDETLIVVTADHDTGGMAMGNNTIPYQSRFGNIPYVHKSKEAFSQECRAMLRDRRVYTWEDMRQKLIDDFGLFTVIPLRPREEQSLKDKFTATFEMRNSEDQRTLYANFDAFSVAVFNLVNEYTGFGFTSTGHTGNPVPLFAVGVGADRFRGLNNNDEIAPIIRSLVAGK